MERLIRLFELEYRQGDQPQIDNYLQSADADDPASLLVELVHTELELRIKSGDSASAEEYLVRYPTLSQDSSIILSLIHTEQRFRQRLGEPTDLSAYGNRFPKLIGQLQTMFPCGPSSSMLGDSSSDRGASVRYSLPATGLFQSRDGLVMGPPPFSSLPRSAQRLLEGHLVERHFSPGEYLLRQGARGDSLMILREGSAEILTQDESGRTFLIAVAGPHDVLGEMALLTDEPCSANVVATSAVEALVLPAEAFHALAAQYPVLSHVLTQIVATRLGGRVRDVLAGKELGGYHIRERAGRGGMSIVYDAEDSQTGRRVALKMMSHRLICDAEALGLFRQEAALIEAFDHPHIIRMYGRFEAFRTYFIVLEFAEGCTLSQFLKSQGRLDAGQTSRILGQVAQAIAYAHSRQVLHRDIKPGNIMLGTDGNAKLMDFGLAMPLGESTKGKSQIVVGTPGYMAPEQAAGGPLTVAADYFSLGCVAYEMCTGERLFPGNDLQAIERSCLDWSPRPFRELCPQADPALAAVLDQCLHPDPRQRTLDLDRLSRLNSAPEQAV